MNTPPIAIFKGNQILYREFSDGNVILPMNNTERSAVASALRDILELVEGDVIQPSFSTEFDCNAGSLQIVTNRDDHKYDADEHRITQPDNQNS